MPPLPSLPGEPADLHLPIRSKYTKKSGRVIAKFDHYCYALGNSVGELAP